MSYIAEGDTVQLNKDIPNKPVMMVYKIKKEQIGKLTQPFNQLIGIECIWFTTSLEVQFATFNFKDLEVLESVQNG